MVIRVWLFRQWLDERDEFAAKHWRHAFGRSWWRLLGAASVLMAVALVFKSLDPQSLVLKIMFTAVYAITILVWIWLISRLVRFIFFLPRDSFVKRR